MDRAGFKLTIRPGSEEEYKKRHLAVHQDLLHAFEEHRIRTYSIFMDGNTLFAYIEAPNVAEVFESLNAHFANIRWQQFMSDILIPNAFGMTMQPLEEVFFFKSTAND